MVLSQIVVVSALCIVRHTGGVCFFLLLDFSPFVDRPHNERNNNEHDTAAADPDGGLRFLRFSGCNRVSAGRAGGCFRTDHVTALGTGGKSHRCAPSVNVYTTPIRAVGGFIYHRCVDWGTQPRMLLDWNYKTRIPLAAFHDLCEGDKC